MMKSFLQRLVKEHSRSLNLRRSKVLPEKASKSMTNLELMPNNLNPRDLRSLPRMLDHRQLEVEEAETEVEETEAAEVAIETEMVTEETEEAEVAEEAEVETEEEEAQDQILLDMEEETLLFKELMKMEIQLKILAEATESIEEDQTITRDRIDKMVLERLTEVEEERIKIDKDNTKRKERMLKTTKKKRKKL